MARIKLYTDSLLDFGKYRGQTVAAVVECDPEYIRWIGRNVRTHVLTDSVKDMLRGEVVGIEPATIDQAFEEAEAYR